VSVDRNMVVHLSLIGASIALALMLHSWLGLLLYLGGFLVNELVDQYFGVSMFDYTQCVRRGYQWFDVFLDRPEGDERDLTEGLFDGRDKSVQQAIHDKYDFIIARLGLRPGDTLLDVGCGYGQFVAYARARGIVARGLTLSPQQAASMRRRGLDVLCADARNPPRELDGQFDAVTFLGCLEHFCESSYWRKPEKEAETFQRVFRDAHRLLKPDSRVRRVFTSTLHRIRNPWSLKDWICGYFMQRHYGGLYPKGDDGLCKHSPPYFQVLERHDRTDDYRITSLKDPLHFGDFSIRWTPGRVLRAIQLVLVDPYALHKWGYHLLGVWMWQLGGRQGAPPERQLTRLWWFLYQAVPAVEANRPG